MIEIIAENIMRWCNNYYKISDRKKELVQFGIEVILDFICDIMGILIIGYMLNRVWEFIISLFAFSSLRLWSGGIHCKTSYGCFCFMVFICSISVFGANLLLALPYWIIYLTLLLLIILTYFYAPMNSLYYRLHDKDKLEWKKKLSLYWIMGESLIILIISNKLLFLTKA